MLTQREVTDVIVSKSSLTTTYFRRYSQIFIRVKFLKRNTKYLHTQNSRVKKRKC